MTIKFTNNAATLLSTGSLADDDTSVAVDDGSVFPALSAGEFFYATLIRANALTTREIVKVTARSGNTLTIVRAQDNTSATTFSADDHIELRIVAATLESLKAADELTAGDAAVTLATSAGNITIDAQGNDTDIILKGTDGSSDTTFVTIDGSDAGTASFNHDVKLANDAAVLGFGAGNDVTLTHVHDTGLLLNGTMQLQFNDASQNITAPSATVLDINATDEVEINATLADVNANLDVSGTYTGGGTMTTGGNIVVPDGGNIGAASDTDAMSISSGGVVAFSAVPTFPNDTIETADIQDNAVTLAKMAGLARGKIIYGDSSGDPAALAVGSANTFLKSDGTDVSWAALSGTAADDISTGDAAVSIATSAGNITIDAQGDDTDIILKGTDGGADTTFLTIDGSDAGTASFNHDVKLASDAAVLGFGAGNDVTLTHVHNSGLTLSAGANHTHFTITSTEDGTSAGPRLSFTRDSTSPADGDDLGMIYFKGKNDADEETQYARIYAEAVDVEDGAEDGRLRLQVMRAGTQTTVIMADDDEVSVTGALNATGTIFADGGTLKAEGTGTTSGTALLTTDSAGTYCTRVMNSGSVITGTKASSPVNNTIGLAANAFISGAGYLRKSTSSLRYKKDVQDLDPAWADKVLDFKPIFFKSNCPKVEGDTHEPDEWTYYGFAAEQVGTIDPRYVFWNREKVDWSNEGRKSTSLIDSDNPHGQAEGVQYDRITVALVDIIKRQKAAIDSLTKRVEALEAK